MAHIREDVFFRAIAEIESCPSSRRLLSPDLHGRTLVSGRGGSRKKIFFEGICSPATFFEFAQNWRLYPTTHDRNAGLFVESVRNHDRSIIG